MECTGLVKSPCANDVVLLFNLCGLNVVDFLVAVILTDPFRRAFVHNFPLATRVRTNSQTRIVLAGSNDSAFDAVLLVSGLLRKHRQRHRKDKRQREQHCELLLQHISLPIIRNGTCNQTLRLAAGRTLPLCGADDNPENSWNASSRGSGMKKCHHEERIQERPGGSRGAPGLGVFISKGYFELTRS